MARVVRPLLQHDGAPGALHLERQGESFALEADAVRIGRLALELGRQLGVDVLVGQRAAEMRVTLARQSVSFERLSAVMREQYEIMVYLGSGQLRVETLGERLERVRRERLSRESRSLEVRALTVSPGRSPAQVAALFCARAASSVGSANVLGDRIILADTPELLDGFEAMMRRLDRTNVR